MSAPTNRVVVDPAIVLQETMVLNDWYRNRNLILAHDNQSLRKQLADLQAEEQVSQTKIESLQSELAEVGERS